MRAYFEKKIFDFKKPSGTSRGILTQKISWFLYLYDENDKETLGVGECSVIPGLSPDYLDSDLYESTLRDICQNINYYIDNLNKLDKFPSIVFGIECAHLDLKNGGKGIYFNNNFSQGIQKIPINGLIWMGDIDFMTQQIEEKIKQGFHCLKLKISSLNFEEEFGLLKSLRDEFSVGQLSIRLDANGAFEPKTCLKILDRLEKLNIHSIEQPIAPKQLEWMKQIIEKSAVPIALDEELIGVNDRFDKEELLDFLTPHYIILKPSLVGGIAATQEWIKYAHYRKIGWWMTSALESNIGLNAIAQFTAEFPITMPQGLGTGSIYKNNVKSDLKVENGHLSLEKNISS